MIIEKLKLYALVALGIVLSLLGMKHYRDKSKKLTQELQSQQRVAKINKNVNEALILAKEEGDKKLAEVLENVKSEGGAYFQRNDSIGGVRDKDNSSK